MLSLTILVINLRVYRYSTLFNHNCPCPCMGENQFNIGNVFWMAITLPAVAFKPNVSWNQSVNRWRWAESFFLMEARCPHSIKWFSFSNCTLCSGSELICYYGLLLCAILLQADLSCSQIILQKLPRRLCQSADWNHQLTHKLNNQLCLTVQQMIEMSGLMQPDMSCSWMCWNKFTVPRLMV